MPRLPIGIEARPYWCLQTFQRIFNWIFKWHYVASPQDKDKYVLWWHYWYLVDATSGLLHCDWPAEVTLCQGICPAQHTSEGQAVWYSTVRACISSRQLVRDHEALDGQGSSWKVQKKLRKAVAHLTRNTKKAHATFNQNKWIEFI